MRVQIYGLIILVTSLVLDIISKMIIVNNLHLGEKIEYLGGFLRITLVYNRGGVFGIAQGYKNVFLVISIIVLIAIIIYYFYEKNKTMLFTVSMALIVSGAIGNIIDRVIPGRTGVVDFISVGFGSTRWPAFNVADSAIVVGAFFLVYTFYKEEIKGKKVNTSEKS